MDVQKDGPVTAPPLAEAKPPFPQCPDCGLEFQPGHLCREGMIEEISRMRAAFQISVGTLARVRNVTMIWRRGHETEKLREVGLLVKKALADIEELICKEKKGTILSDEVKP